MKRLLPIVLCFAFVFISLISPAISFAQLNNTQSPTDSRWVIDPEVTFIGKNARRSGDFLDWTLQNYNWVCVKQINARQCDDTNNPIEKYWSLIVLYIVVPMLFIVILATSIVIIVTRGKSLTIMRFIPRFIAVVLLIVFSYSLLQFFYQFTDLIQGFFLRSTINNPCPPNCISDKDLLYVGWDYTHFVGLRLLGDKYAESAFISLLLTKLTALTYFVMVFLLLVRKIILWFFIIVSPIFPILLLYYPVRNTGKIWIGEFFRWLLYAPLFAIFLNGLVYLWRNQIPLVFNNPNIGNASAIEYPTAVNILLGGPRQQVTPTNSVNLPETFALYVVSLIMLWIVILLPWILLQIFLDYAQNFAPGDTAVMKTLVNMATSPKGSGPSPAGESGGGAAISLPFAKKFNIPTGLTPGPTGAAKELKIGNVTADTVTATGQATFSRPAMINTAEINNANVNASVLSTADIKLPNMRDIAKFDIALRSNDVSKQSEVNRFSEQLVKISNPVVVTNTVEKDKYVEIREKLGQQSQKGNVAANNVMNAAKASNSSLSNVSNAKVKSMLAQMANPDMAKGVDKEKMTQLNSMLKSATSASSSTASKTNTSATSKDQISSQLAQSILKVNDKTSDKEVQKIKDQLHQASNSSVSKAVTSAITQTAKSSTQMSETLKQVANPSTVTRTEDKARVEKLRSTLEKASKEGNTLASSILSVNNKTSATEIEALQERIAQAKDKGEPLATELASAAASTNMTTLPMVNKVQTVKKEDYQAVKDMWKQNYQNLEVPQGMAGSRSDWIKDDIAGIDETIALLSSPDQDKQQQGMDQVSNLLPFLLVGGFSQTEIIDYLKAKQEAAKEVSTSLAADEEDKVGISTRTTHAAQTMSASMTEEPSGSSAGGSIGISSGEDEEESPLSSISNVSNVSNTTTYTQPEISNEIMNMVNVKVPKLSDIAKFETQTMQKDTTKQATRETMQNALAKIANPAQITDPAERQKFEQVHDKLVSEQQNGNPTAGFILNAAMRAQGAAPQSAKDVLAKIANPSLATAEADKKRFNALHESLSKASKEGNPLATSILSTNEATSAEDIEKLQSKIQEAREQGESVAASVSPALATEAALPTVNKIQTVSNDEYQAVKNTWKQNYQNQEVPQGGSRTDWIKQDIADIDQTIGLLSSSDKAAQQQGMDQVSSVLPFLLAGGFSQNEIISYLKAKQEAGGEVAAQLAKDEEDKVGVSAGTQSTQAQQTMSASVTHDTSAPAEEESALSSQSMSSASAQPAAAQNDLLVQANLTIPKMIDVAKYETRKVTSNKEEAERQEKTQEALMKLANPAKFVTEEDRQKFEDLRQKLADDSQKGDATAGQILSAATSATDGESGATLPATNQTQAVSQQDYDEVEKLWEENYRTLPIPAEYGTDRVAWIEADISNIEETMALLNEQMIEKQKEGMKRVSDIMPMLLLGGFSIDEVVGYLKAKLEAGKKVLVELQKEEENSVTVEAKAGEKQEEQEQEIEEKPEKTS